MKKIIFTLFLLFIPNISIAEFVTLNCEGQIRQITTDIKGKTSKTEAFYETLKFNIIENKVVWVTTETSHSFNRPFVYQSKKKAGYGFFRASDDKKSFMFSDTAQTNSMADSKYFSKNVVEGIKSRFSSDTGKYFGGFYVSFYLKNGRQDSLIEFDFETNCSGVNNLLVALNQTTDSINVADDEIVPASSGTGFIITNSGHMVTNYHVVQGCHNVKALYNGKEYDTEVLAVDKINDLAVIKANLRPRKIYSISSEDGQLLEEVIVAGYPLGKKVSASIKATSGTITALSGLGDNYGEFQTDAALNSGNSGGPVIDEMGNVVGVAVSKIQEEGVESFNFGIKSSILRVFLKSNKINLIPPKKREMKKKELGQLITDATIYLDCFMTGKQLKKLIREQAKSQKAIYKNFN